MKRYITSRLDVEYRDILERMFYYHPEQSVLDDIITRHVQQYGTPQISSKEGLLTIRVPALPGALTFYAVEEQDEGPVKLLGVMVIDRSSESVLEMHHIAISPELTSLQVQEGCSVAALMIGGLCRIGRSIRGIEKIKLAYHRGVIPVGLEIQNHNQQ